MFACVRFLCGLWFGPHVQEEPDLLSDGQRLARPSRPWGSRPRGSRPRLSTAGSAHCNNYV